MGQCCQLRYRPLHLVFVFIYTICTLCTIQSCSPPQSRFGEQSVRQLSELGRSDKAEIIVLGTVVSMYPDKQIQSMMVDIAVHMVLKSKKRMIKIIKVSGFENAGKNNRNTLFVHQASTDCVTTEVNLYGTYVFFLRMNKYGEYSVDEINFQPAVTEISCSAKLSKELKHLIKKYRKSRKNKSQCNDFENSKTNTSRKCLKHRHFTQLLNNFKYKLLPIRKYYCSIKLEAIKQREKKRKNRKNRKKKKKNNNNKELQMRDIIQIAKQNNKESTVTTTSNQNNDTDDDEIDSTLTAEENANKLPTNIILYSKNENYIVHQNSNQHLHVKLRNWRLFNDGKRTSSSAASSLKLASYNYGHFILLLFLAVMTSLAYIS